MNCSVNCPMNDPKNCAMNDVMNRAGFLFRLLWLLVVIVVLAACNHTPPGPAGGSGRSAQSYTQTKDGHYRVRRGDSLHAIAFRYGLDWRDIARWNGIDSPYIIYPDQQLWVAPPQETKREAAAASTQVVKNQTDRQADAKTSGVQTTGRSEPAPARTVDIAARSTTRQIEESPPESAAGRSVSPAPTRAADETSALPSAKPDGSVTGADPKSWLWPTHGRVISNFRPDDPARKGIDISGKRGQPVVSAASGQVVYSGNGLLGYGELIIIKHSERMLSAYAHNSKRLVGEGESVKAGQHIAAMGTDERNDAILHFEIRVNGKPSDPLKYLSRLK